MTSSQQQIIIYQEDNGNARVEVTLADENLWLSIDQMAELFDRDKSVIAKHLKNIFREEELIRNSVVANFATTAKDGKTYQVEFFNLDAIISVGYRVNSKRGTAFRRWSSQVLREYLQQGYAINGPQIDKQQIKQLQQTIELLSHTLINQELVSNIGQEVLTIIGQYSKTWNILLRYDEERLENRSTAPDDIIDFQLEEAKLAIIKLKEELANKKEASALFGNMKDHQLDAILASLKQTFDGQPVYLTHIARAAHLLYFIIKDHPFSDGNKRIGCLLFLLYLHKTKLKLNLPDNSSLVAMALLIAESNPANKDLMIQLIICLLESDTLPLSQQSHTS